MVSVHVVDGTLELPTNVAWVGCSLKATEQEVASDDVFLLKQNYTRGVAVASLSHTHPGRVFTDIYLRDDGAEQRAVKDQTTKWLEQLRKATSLLVSSCHQSVLVEMEQYPAYMVARSGADAAEVWRLLQEKLDAGMRVSQVNGVESAMVWSEFCTLCQGETETAGEYFGRQDVLMQVLTNQGVKVKSDAYQELIIGITLKNLNSQLKHYYSMNVFMEKTMLAKTIAEVRALVVKWEGFANSTNSASTQMSVHRTEVVKSKGGTTKDLKMSKDPAVLLSEIAKLKRKIAECEEAKGADKEKRPPKEKWQKRDASTVECYACHKKGHFSYACPTKTDGGTKPEGASRD